MARLGFLALLVLCSPVALCSLDSGTALDLCTCLSESSRTCQSSVRLLDPVNTQSKDYNGNEEARIHNALQTRLRTSHRLSSAFTWAHEEGHLKGKGKMWHVRVIKGTKWWSGPSLVCSVCLQYDQMSERNDVNMEDMHTD